LVQEGKVENLKEKKMGSSRWDSASYASYSTSTSKKTRKEIFTNESGCHDDLNPAKFAVRESCDSEANPNSTPIIIGVDETGSMGFLAEEIIKQGLGVIVQGIYERNPVPDPHILLAAIGDATCDFAPIQTTQFEADVKITEQIEKFYLEGRGGGNNGESYPLLWWFAAFKTKCDAFSKGRKGYLFTIGDEAPLKTIGKDEIKTFLGADVSENIDIASLLEEVQETWEVFHLITPTAATERQKAVQKWSALLQERAIVVSDAKRLGEVIVSILQVNEGQNEDDVAASWDGETKLVVSKAVHGLSKKSKTAGGITVVDV
jgi:hypothetical protein